MTTLVVLGASGDLASRLLLPALGQLLTVETERRVRLVGAGMEAYAPDSWRERVSAAFAASTSQGAAVDAVLSDTAYVQADVTSDAGLRNILEACEGPIALYFALPPAVAVNTLSASTSL